MKIFALLFVYLVTSCSQASVNENMPQTNIQSAVLKPVEKVAEGKPLQKLSAAKGKIKPPVVKDFSVFFLHRNSDNHDAGGTGIAPFKSAEIPMHTENEAKTGEKVTIIPLGVKIEPFQLAISKVTKQRDTGCDDPNPDFRFEIEHESITDKTILETDSKEQRADGVTFGVFTIYPAVEFVRNILPPELKPEMIPKGIAIETVEAAVDLGNDGKPDLLALSFCCADENEPVTSQSDNCFYSCEKYFKKINGAWKLIRSENPC